MFVTCYIIFNEKEMNQTGLRESMYPSLSSKLFDKNLMTDSLVQSTFQEVTESPHLINQFKTPIVFDIMPLIENPELITISSGQIIPTCARCHSFPNKYTKVLSKTWKCTICNHQNKREENYVFPESKYYQILGNIDEHNKPLHMFIIQENPFFLSSKESLSDAIDNWKNQNPGVNLCLFTIGDYITTYDLYKSQAHIIIDSDDFDTYVCPSDKANISSSFRQIQPKQSMNPICFFKLLSAIFKKFENAQHDINIIILANQFDNDDESKENITNFLKITSKRYLNLFTTQNAENCLWFANLSYKIKLFDEKEASLVVPVLRNWLNSGALYRSHLRFFYNPISFTNHFITSRYCANSDDCWIPFIDGESSFSIETTMQKGSSGNAVFQVILHSLFNNGVTTTRVITWDLQQSHKITRFDGICLGVYMAREAAVNLDLEKQQDTYNEHLESCLKMVMAWSSKGVYYRKMNPLFKDAPILMNSITKSGLFNINKIVALTAKINFPTMSLTRVCRSIYPILILPPLKFPHRLAKENIVGFKTALIVGPFTGKVFGDEESLKDIEVINIPFLKEDNIRKLENYMIEDKQPSFAYFAENIEVECSNALF